MAKLSPCRIGINGDSVLIKHFSDSVNDIINKNFLNTRLGNFNLVNFILDANGRPKFYLISNNDQKTLLLVIRGTANKEESNFNLKSRPVPINTGQFGDLPVNALIHEGFFEHFNLYSQQVITMVENSIRNFQDYSFVIVGHSLGGATGFLHAADLSINAKIPITAVYLYGAPIIGNLDLTDYLANQIGNHKILRIVNANDIVSHLGFMSDHPSNVQEVFFPVDSLTPNICVGNKDPNCSSGVLCQYWTWADHSGLGMWSMRKEWCRYNTIYQPTVQY